MVAISVLSGPAFAGRAASNWNKVSDVLAVGLPLAAAGYSYGADDMDGLRQLGWSVGTAYLSTKVIKAVVPVHTPDGSGDDSFPSGHTAVAFAVARFMDVRYGGVYSPWIYGAAAATGMARVESKQHRWGDVVAGGLLGWVSSQWLTSSMLKREGIQSSQLSLMPMAHGVSVRWSATW